MRILMSAYACSPEEGSERSVGWNWARVMSRWHEVWVITRRKHRRAIETEFAKNPYVNLRFVYVDLPGRARWWWKTGKVFGWARYTAWQLAAYLAARKLHKRYRFHLAHHVTFVSWRTPSFVWRLGVPFIWGPVGGGQEVPPGFGGTLGVKGIWQETVRWSAQRFSRLDPFLRATGKNAAAVLAANRETAGLLSRSLGAEARTFPGIGIDGRELSVGAQRKEADSEELNTLWAGRLVPLKGLPLLLRALAVVKDGVDFRLRIAGAGPERRRWERMGYKAGIGHRIKFLGSLPRSEVFREYEKADVFVFTSLRDSSGMVLLEAMAAGLPVICLNHGGPGLIASPECATMIEPRSEEYVVEKLAEAINLLARDPECRRRMGLAAHKRAGKMFRWDELGERMNGVYEFVVGERQTEQGFQLAGPNVDTMTERSRPRFASRNIAVLKGDRTGRRERQTLSCGGWGDLYECRG